MVTRLESETARKMSEILLFGIAHIRTDTEPIIDAVVCRVHELLTDQGVDHATIE